MIDITLNGEAREVPAGTVSALLMALEIPREKVAIERNLTIVPRSAYDSVSLESGDRIEVVQFVGGG